MFLTQPATWISIIFFKQADQQQSRINKNQKDEDEMKIKVSRLKAWKPKIIGKNAKQQQKKDTYYSLPEFERTWGNFIHLHIKKNNVTSPPPPLEYASV